MKKRLCLRLSVLLLFSLLLCIAELSAQKLYVPGKIVKGTTASYYCKADGRLMLEVRNVNNVDTTYDMYFNNGQLVPSTYELGSTVNTKQEELVRVFREVLTLEEWNALKGKAGYFLGLTVVADSRGNTVEIMFQFRDTDPVMTKMDPDRLYQLEQKLKKILKLTPSESDSKIRNIKYIQAINFAEMK